VVGSQPGVGLQIETFGEGTQAIQPLAEVQSGLVGRDGQGHVRQGQLGHQQEWKQEKGGQPDKGQDSGQAEPLHRVSTTAPSGAKVSQTGSP